MSPAEVAPSKDPLAATPGAVLEDQLDRSLQSHVNLTYQRFGISKVGRFVQVLELT